MQERYNSFDVLKNELLEKLKARGCSSITITGYRYLYNSIISWLKNNGYEFYTKEAGNAFLQDYLSIHGKNQYYTNLRTVVYRLNDLVDGKWFDVHSDKGKHFILSDEFIDIVNRYCSIETAKGLANGTIKYKRYAISWFFHELGVLQCFSLTQISPKLLPLIGDVSAAIDDYLAVRPSSMAKEIFINIYAPYNPISTGTIRNLLKKHISAAEIDVGNRKKGPHALRSSLASSMVNDDVSYETVRKVLGHSSNNAIKHYARIDVEKLRQYCLEPPQISGKFKAFLKGEVI